MEINVTAIVFSKVANGYPTRSVRARAPETLLNSVALHINFLCTARMRRRMERPKRPLRIQPAGKVVIPRY